MKTLIAQLMILEIKLAALDDSLRTREKKLATWVGKVATSTVSSQRWRISDITQARPDLAWPR
jgi:hypothetical protein